MAFLKDNYAITCLNSFQRKKVKEILSNLFMYARISQKSNSEKARLTHKDMRRTIGNLIKDITKDGTQDLADPSGEVHKKNTRILVSWKTD